IVASGPITRSTAEWLMSRSCQSAMSSSAASAWARTRRASPHMFSASTGFRLCGIADEPFCPGAKGSAASPTSVRCRWRISRAMRSHVPVPGHDLRRDRLGLEPEAHADGALDGRIVVSERADRTRELPVSDADARRREPPPVTAELRPPARALEAEGDRLRMDPVRPADHGRVALLNGLAAHRLP